MGVDLVERHLENWVNWHKISTNRLGYPTRAMVAAGGGQSVSGVFDEMCADADRHAAEITEALVSDLPLDQKGAIYHHWLGCVIRVRDQVQSLEKAYVSLLIKMNARGLA